MAKRVGRLRPGQRQYLEDGVHQVFWGGEFWRVLVAGGFYLRLTRVA